MIDFYEELDLDETSDVQDIQDELDRLEVIWQRRMTSNLETAQKKLDIIEKAQKVFFSEESKKKYDKELYEFKHPPVDDTDAKRKEEFLKYKQMAEAFLERKEYDLAKDAVSKAASLADEDPSSAEFFEFAASIFMSNEDTSQALSYINKAILLDNFNPEYYYCKSRIFANEEKVDEYISLLQKTIEYAEKKNDEEFLALSYDDLAEVYYYFFKDEDKGYEYAKKAVAINKDAAHSPAIIEEVDKKRADERERARLEEERRRQYENICELYAQAKKIKDFEEILALMDSTLPFNYPDPENIRENCKNRIARIANARINVLIIKITAVVFVLVLLITLVFIPMNKSHKAKDMVRDGNYSQALVYAAEKKNSYKDRGFLSVGIDEAKVAKAICKQEDAQYFRFIKDSVILFYSDAKVKIIAPTENDYYADLSKFKNVKDIYYSNNHVVALENDGTAEAAYELHTKNKKGQADLSGWTDIVSIAVTDDVTVGLRQDGTVIAAGDNSLGQCEVTDWYDIEAVYAYKDRTIGIKTDGTVVSTQFNGREEERDDVLDLGQCDVSSWTDVVGISFRKYQTIGIKADGTIVATKPGANSSGKDNQNARNTLIEPSKYKDVAMIEGDLILKTDGTIEPLVPTDKYEDWDKLVSIKTVSDGYVIGLKRNGDVISAQERRGLSKIKENEIARYYSEKDFDIPELMKDDVKF